MGKKSHDANNANVYKDYLLIIIIAAIGSAITIVVFFRIFSISRQSIINTWSAKTIIMAQDVEHYLSVPSDAVLFASRGVEEMLDEGATNAEINDFLINETAIYSDVIESNSTGIYGYVNGEYLDSSGWIPPVGFDPLQRPWYLDAVKSDGEIAFVEPYLNVQTNTLMMSVSKLLNDKKSVLSMDIFLDTIQGICEDMYEYEDMEMSLVIDRNGLVVAHSDQNEIGKNYSTDGIAFHKSIQDGVLSQKDYYTLSEDGTPKILNRRGGEIRLYEVFEKRLFDNIERVTISGVNNWKLHVSVGATFCNPDVCISFDEYFKQADTAMYNSKQREGNQLTFFANNDKT